MPASRANPSKSVPAFENAKEFDGTVSDISGAVPPGLVGRLLRNSPGDRTGATHYFDGDGFVSAVQFREDGTVHVQGRYVDTARRRAVESRRRGNIFQLPFPGFGTRAPLGPLGNNLPRLLRGATSNTSVLSIPGHLLALCDMGMPVSLEPSDLRTQGLFDFAGKLRKGEMFSPHTRTDPETGDVYAFTQQNSRQSILRVYRIDPAGKLHTVQKLIIPAAPLHDFALTENYCIFCLPPLAIPTGVQLKVFAGLTTCSRAFEYDHGAPTRVVVVPRDGSAPRWLDAPPAFQFHYAGAYEKGSEIVVDTCSQPSWEGLRDDLENFRAGGWTTTANTILRRLHIDTVSGAVRAEKLTDYLTEFAQPDPRLEGRPYRFIYHVSNTDGRGGFQSALARTDLQNGTAQRWDFGPGSVTTEPSFVARPGGAIDEGWLVSQIFDGGRNATDIVVFDAAQVSDGPICTVHVPTHVGVPLHGSFEEAQA